MATKKTTFKTVPIADAKVEAAKARVVRAAKKKAARDSEVDKPGSRKSPVRSN